MRAILFRQTGHKKKLNAYIEFSELLDLGPFMEDKGKAELGVGVFPSVWGPPNCGSGPFSRLPGMLRGGAGGWAHRCRPRLWKSKDGRWTGR